MKSPHAGRQISKPAIFRFPYSALLYSAAERGSTTPFANRPIWPRGPESQVQLRLKIFGSVASTIAVVAPMIAVAIAGVAGLVGRFGISQFQLLLIERFAVKQGLKPELLLYFFHCASPKVD